MLVPKLHSRKQLFCKNITWGLTKQNNLVPRMLLKILRLCVKPVLRIRMFLGLLDPDPDPLVRGTDPAPAPDPSIIKQK
jgi:hypothetical protein